MLKMGPKPNDGKDSQDINYVSIFIIPKIEELCNGVNSRNKNRNSISTNLFLLIGFFMPSSKDVPLNKSFQRRHNSHNKLTIHRGTTPVWFVMSYVGHNNISLRLFQSSYTRN